MKLAVSCQVCAIRGIQVFALTRAQKMPFFVAVLTKVGYHFTYTNKPFRKTEGLRVRKD